MIRLLSAVGRATIVIAAVFIIVGSTVAGYVDADTRPYLFGFRFAREYGALIGLVAGIVAAGIVLGPLATLYDIRDNMRRLAKGGEGEAALRADRAA